MRIAVLGAGSWGTALAILLARKGSEVVLWGRHEDRIEDMDKARENKRYLPGFYFPDTLNCTISLENAFTDTKTVIMAVPSTAVRSVAREIKGLLPVDSILIHAGKGLESDTGLRGSEVIAQELGNEWMAKCAVLSGPNLAVELARGIPTATVAASVDDNIAKFAQELFHTPTLRVYRASDVIGVELGGALKNVMAIGSGMSDGLGFGDNTKATLVTRGLREMTRLGEVMGADPYTFTGLSGIGDLMATCSSRLSRNLRLGVMIGEGKSLDESQQSLGQVAEGVHTCEAAYILSKKYDVCMPITEIIHQILFEGKSPNQGVMDLMNRSYKEEKG